MAASEYGLYNQNHSPPVSPRSQPLSLKRRAPDDEVETHTAISNHFKKLRLNNAKLPSASQISPVGVSFRNVSSPSSSPALRAISDGDLMLDHPAQSQSGAIDDDFMPIDETPNRIYIHDLESEIAEIEASEAREKTQLFLPDVDKKVGQIPQRLLESKPGDADGTSNMQMVLYQEPTSISVPEEEDAVRLAVIAARARVRERQKEEREDIENARERANLNPVVNVRDEGESDYRNGTDPDEMDLG